MSSNNLSPHPELPETQLRVEALHHASRHGLENGVRNPKAIVEDAELYLAFLKGQSGK